MTFVRRETYYETLGVKRTSDQKQIFSRFNELESFWKAMADNSPGEANLKLLELRLAFSILSNEKSKQTYDNGLDFEFVLLDGKTKDADLEEAYEIYRQNQNKSYQEIFSEFQLFKEDLSTTLWLLKSTTLYLILSLFFYSGMILLFSLVGEYSEINFSVKTNWKNLIVPSYIPFAGFGYLLFRKYIQIPLLIKRKNMKTNQN